MVSDLTECGFRVHECKAKCQNVQKMIFFLGFNLSIWLNVVGGTGQVDAQCEGPFQFKM